MESVRAGVAIRGAGRLKHLEVRELWLQDPMRNGEVAVKCVGTTDNPADLVKKHFGGPRYRVRMELIGLRCDAVDA
eukprot:9807568-Heterocapsa_arctica.AAC.1